MNTHMIVYTIYFTYIVSITYMLCYNNFTFSKNFQGPVLKIYRQDSILRFVCGLAAYSVLLVLLPMINLGTDVYNVMLYTGVFLVVNILINSLLDKYTNARLLPIVQELKRQEELAKKKEEFLFNKKDN